MPKINLKYVIIAIISISLLMIVSALIFASIKPKPFTNQTQQPSTLQQNQTPSPVLEFKTSPTSAGGGGGSHD